MKISRFITATALSLASVSICATEVEVAITNSTQGIYFTPLLVAVHSKESRLFKLGQPASPELRAMAEGGDISGLAGMVIDSGGTVVENPAQGLLAPGMPTKTETMMVSDGAYLSITAMLLPTNDGFVGLDSWEIPSTPGEYTLMLNGYDAGTEANNELIVTGSGMPGVLGIPANPGANSGDGGTGVTELEANTNVHIHRGTLGDDDMTGGPSDLQSSLHRWLNPVARVVVTITE